jgi:hypothetical protein
MPTTPVENINQPSTEEGLELFRAFMQIKTATDRQKVIELAKRLSGASK